MTSSCSQLGQWNVSSARFVAADKAQEHDGQVNTNGDGGTRTGCPHSGHFTVLPLAASSTVRFFEHREHLKRMSLMAPSGSARDYRS